MIGGGGHDCQLADHGIAEKASFLEKKNKESTILAMMGTLEQLTTIATL